MQKKRLLFITPLPPPVHGSAMVSQYIKECRELQDEFQCDFVNLSTSRHIDEIGKRSLMKYIRFFGAYFITFWRLLTHRYALCYLAITCHGLGFLKDAPFVLLCKLFGRKVVIHQHNKGMSKCVEKQPYKWLLPVVYRNTKVILLSWHLYTDIEKIVKKEQVIICPNGILELFDEEPHFERNNNVPQLLFLSNLIPSKGVYVLLDALKILKEKGYKFLCNFVGGESKEITKEIFAQTVEERELDGMAMYHGPKYGKEKTAFFTNSDIFVQPTFEDCFPLTLLEAMQYKLPIVSTDEGAVPDMVKNETNGFVCKRMDVDSTADAIARLLDSKELRTLLGENGYRLFKKYYTLDVFNKGITEILKEQI
ncbi:MAG: glycosyltransferase family 4 protein [Bacteroidaceae bacterium]|nr:glycosyltransferase family 4 protein [Bacteroidaceae bacterium]